MVLLIRPDLLIIDDITIEEDMRQQHIVAGTKRARQLQHSHTVSNRTSNHQDVGVKGKKGWKFITAADGSISKVRA